MCRLGFEVLTATRNEPTAGARFTHALIRLLDRGDPAAPERLRCVDARNWVAKAHPELSPQLSSQNPDGHFYLGCNGARVAGELLYATPSQTNLDRNTVDMDRERASFGDNAIKYEATLRFINSNVRTSLQAITGQ